MAKGRMPDGVVSMAGAAKGVRLRPERGLKILTATWDSRTKAKMSDRKKLLAGARAGDAKAIKRLADEFKCRIWYEHEIPK